MCFDPPWSQACPQIFTACFEVSFRKSLHFWAQREQVVPPGIQQGALTEKSPVGNSGVNKIIQKSFLALELGISGAAVYYWCINPCVSVCTGLSPGLPEPGERGWLPAVSPGIFLWPRHGHPEQLWGWAALPRGTAGLQGLPRGTRVSWWTQHTGTGGDTSHEGILSFFGMCCNHRGHRVTEFRVTKS